jgi:DNA repair photolyase
MDRPPPLVDDWLARHEPGKRDRVLQRIRSLRGGRMNDARFGARMQGQGPFAELIEQLFATGLRKAGLSPRGPRLSTASFHRPGTTTQLTLFE